MAGIADHSRAHENDHRMRTSPGPADSPSTSRKRKRKGKEAARPPTELEVNGEPSPIKQEPESGSVACQTPIRQSVPLRPTTPQPNDRSSPTKTPVKLDLRPEPETPQDKTESSSTKRIWAVKVGWHPGLYNKDDAKHQTHHYPNKELKGFETEEEATAWLVQPSENLQIDLANRPEHYDRVDRAAWTRYLEKTWNRTNRLPDVGTKEMLKMLRLLFVKASEDFLNHVDWNVHPLPQHLVSATWLSEGLTPLRLHPGALRPRAGPERINAPCSCGQIICQTEDDTVTCANVECTIYYYHRACVGLSNRPKADNWRCFPCRPKSVPQVSATGTASSSLANPPPLAQPIAYTPIAHGPPEPPLHPEQRRVVDAILQGNNVFYTGSAGVGKSTVLKAFVKELQGLGRHVDIVAPSGIAALNVGGSTIFSYAGWVPDSFKKKLPELRQQAHRKNIWEKLNKTDVLVIDEISMVEADMLVRLDSVMRDVRDSYFGAGSASVHTKDLPFGGVQVVVTGDFCQLPPVRPFRFCVTCGGEELEVNRSGRGPLVECENCGMFDDKDKWAFCADVWNECNFTCFELRHIHRQSDSRFVNILQRCRFGLPLSVDDRNLLVKSKPNPVGAVKLLPRRAEVEAENRRNFDSIDAPILTFDCYDKFFFRSEQEPELKKKGQRMYHNRPEGPLTALKDHRFEQQIQLKEGMLVILLVNLDFNVGLVNGSQGKIIGFEKHEDLKVFPPRPVEPNSPAKSGRVNFAKEKKQAGEHAAIRELWIQDFAKQAPVKEWPIVQFQNGIVQPIYPQCQLSELGAIEPYSLLGRTQIPLLAAWAITVHKSQGMTLNTVIVDLYNSFEREMVYVALSRARTLEGLRVVRLARQMDSCINEEVHQFLAANDLLGGQKKLEAQL